MIKNLYALSRLFFVLALFSCEKNTTPDEPLPPAPPPPVVEKNDSTQINLFYNTPGREYGLQADLYHLQYKARVLLYGSFNSNGNTERLKSFSVEQEGSDTVYNYFFNEEKQLEYFYYSLKSGEKSNRVCKLEYPASDSVRVNVYEYDWDDHFSSLVFQKTTHLVNKGSYQSLKVQDETLNEMTQDETALYTDNVTASLQSFKKELIEILQEHSVMVAVGGTAIACIMSGGAACVTAAVLASMFLAGIKHVSAATLPRDYLVHASPDAQGTLQQKNYMRIAGKKWRLTRILDRGTPFDFGDGGWIIINNSRISTAYPNIEYTIYDNGEMLVDNNTHMVEIGKNKFNGLNRDLYSTGGVLLEKYVMTSATKTSFVERIIMHGLGRPQVTLTCHYKLVE